jgi:predicted ATPase
MSGEGPLEHIINKLRIHSLKGQVAAAREQSKTLAKQFESATTNTEKLRIARRYDEALKQAHAMQLLLEMLEREAVGA